MLNVHYSHSFLVALSINKLFVQSLYSCTTWQWAKICLTYVGCPYSVQQIKSFITRVLLFHLRKINNTYVNLKYSKSFKHIDVIFDDIIHCTFRMNITWTYCFIDIRFCKKRYVDNMCACTRVIVCVCDRIIVLTLTLDIV